MYGCLPFRYPLQLEGSTGTKKLRIGFGRIGLKNEMNVENASQDAMLMRLNNFELDDCPS